MSTKLKSMYNKIPDTLQGRVILITGTFPGVGKSYVKDNWALKLRASGYRVFNRGTTNKASSDETVHTGERKRGKFDIAELDDIHPLTEGFYFIDEAWMWKQECYDALVKSYPHMCFILFGDPLQLSIVELQNGSTLCKYDLGFSLDKEMRTDQEIYNALKQMKEGQFPFEFIQKHTKSIIDVDTTKKSVIIVLKNETRDYWNAKTNKIEAGQIYRVKSLDVHNIQNRNWRDFEWTSGEMYTIKLIDEINGILLERLDETKSFYVSEKTLHQYFEYSVWINLHKVQGDTIRNANIIIDIEDFSINHDILRQLYVAISRATNANQIIFLKDSIEQFYRKNLRDNNIIFTPIKSPINFNNLIETDSIEMCQYESGDNIIDFLCKKCPAASRIYTQSNFVKVLTTAALTPCGVELTDDHNSVAAYDNKYNIVNTQGCGELIDISSGPDYKKQRHAIQKYLREHDGQGYSIKWNDSERVYADSIRQKYTLFGKFVAKTESDEQEEIDEKAKGISFSKGLKPEETEAERKARKVLSCKKSRFYAKMFREGKTVSEIDALWKNQVSYMKK